MPSFLGQLPVHKRGGPSTKMACVDPRAAEGAIDAHSHIVTPDVLALLERDGAHYATRIITSEGQRQFLVGESATPVSQKP